MKRESLNRMAKLFEKFAESVIEEVKAADLECDEKHRKDVIDLAEDMTAQAVDIVYSIAEKGGGAVFDPPKEEKYTYPITVISGARDEALKYLDGEHAEFVRKSFGEILAYLQFVSDNNKLED